MVVDILVSVIDLEMCVPEDSLWRDDDVMKLRYYLM